MKKKQNTKRNLLENIKLLQSKGFIVIGTFIVGLDNYKEEILPNLAGFIQESGLILVVVNVLKAPPGTVLYERMKKENRLVDTLEFNEDRTNIIPVMDKKILHNGYKMVLQNVYNPENALQRILTYYSNLNTDGVKKSIKRKVTLRDFFIFIGIIFKIEIGFSKRNYFWQLILWTIKNKRNYLDLSILFSFLSSSITIYLMFF